MCIQVHPCKCCIYEAIGLSEAKHFNVKIYKGFDTDKNNNKIAYQLNTHSNQEAQCLPMPVLIFKYFLNYFINI